jgi:hypothetical protein
MQDSPAESETDRSLIFVHGNLEFILLHELAHVIIEEFDVPILGSVESAADHIATVALIRGDRPDPEQIHRARQFIAAVASGFAAQWNPDHPPVNELLFWDNHGLTIQRFFQITCLLYGSSPSSFPNLPSRAGLPAARAAQCESEFARADRSFQWLIDTFSWGSTINDSHIVFEYDEPPSRVSRRILEYLRNMNALESAAEQLTQFFKMSRPTKIHVRDCRSERMTWDNESHSITLCYELFDYYYLLSRNSRKREMDRVFENDNQ